MCILSESRIVLVTILALHAANVCAESKSDAPSKLESIKVADEFTVELVAEAPLVKYPMLGEFDESGRLFVCESVGENLNAEQLLKRLPNFIRMLEDTDGDGAFDKSTIFADKMTLPTGVLWHDGALYVAAPPSIWRLEDTDGDGVADKRDELVTGFKFRGHAGDIHGPYLGPTGRLFFVDGIMGHEIRDKSGEILSKGSAARIFTSRLDGSDLETFCGGGMANPVAVTFTDEGEVFGATTFFNYSPRDRVRHDAFFHAVYGGVYPRKVGYLKNEFQLTGPLLPPLIRFGMSAPSNLMTYRSGAFGDSYRGNILISHFNHRNVVRVRLQRDGSTFQTRHEKFLTSSNPDFHPCDVIEDADGSLLIIDTGGWFKIGCPTSSLQPKVTGGIYRVRLKGHKAVADPRGYKIAWNSSPQKLTRFLNDNRFVVRDRAILELTKRGNAAIEAFRIALTSNSVQTRRNAVWTLTRIGTADALAATRTALPDSDAGVRNAACICAATHRDAAALESLINLLDDQDHGVRRQAAAALGRIGDPRAVLPLLRSFKSAGDRMLEHAITFAVIEINDPESTRDGLKNESPSVQRAALIALDQMKKKTLTREMLALALKTDDVPLQQAALDVVTRHVEWAGVVKPLMKRWLQDAELSEQRLTLLRDALHALRNQAECQSLITELLTQAKTPLATRHLLLDVIVEGGFRELPKPWAQLLLANLQSRQTQIAQKSMAAISSSNSAEFDPQLTSFVEDGQQPMELRVQAAGILARRLQALSDATFELLCSQCNPDTPFETRIEAARAIGNLKLSPNQIDRATELLAQAGPLELPLFLKSLTRVWTNGSAAQQDDLIAAVQASPGFRSLTEDQLKQFFTEAPANVKSVAKPIIERVKLEYAQSIREAIRTTFILKGGNAVRGKEIFYSKQALCAECHRAGPKQDKFIGPDLRRIGEIRSHRDLLESILAPSTSFARGFEPKTIVLQSGKVITGVIHQETDDMLVIHNSQRQQIRVARADVASISASKTSIMPQGLERTLTSDDLRDLLAFLKTLKNREAAESK